ncbi:MAG: hypothetical protein V4707_06065 [Pseudomonadota bacterium]
MADEPKKDQEPPNIPALFATIHFQSEERPDGYTYEDIQALNTLASTPRPKPAGRTLVLGSICS